MGLFDFLKKKETRRSAKPISTNIVKLKSQNIFIDTFALKKWAEINKEYYEYQGSMLLKETSPIISVYENKKLVQSYTLETKTGEDYTGKYFHISINLTISSDHLTPVAVIDGFVADSQEETKMEFKHICYRFEVLFLDRESEATKIWQARVTGNDLYAKALRKPGYITPGNVRLVGVCQSCRKSFTFIGYNFPHMQAEAAYSDDGLDVMELSAYEQIDKNTWSCEQNGKTFRYYNSFNCPHCGEPYIDYKKYPEIKEFGVLGCTLLGRDPYKAD